MRNQDYSFRRSGLFLTEMFQWNGLRSCVPLTSHPNFLNFLRCVPNVESCGIKFSHQLCMTCCHNLQLKWQYAQQDDAFQFANATFLYIVRKRSLLLAIYAHSLAPVPAHHKPCHFCKMYSSENIHAHSRIESLEIPRGLGGPSPHIPISKL